MPPCEGYRFQKEFESAEELENISADLDLIRIQSLLIAERILGPHHKDTIFRWEYLFKYLFTRKVRLPFLQINVQGGFICGCNAIPALYRPLATRARNPN